MFWNQVEKEKENRKKRELEKEREREREWVYVCCGEKTRGKKKKRNVWMKEGKNNIKNKKWQFKNATQYFHNKS